MTYVIVSEHLQSGEISRGTRQYTLEDAEAVCERLNRIFEGVQKFWVEEV